MEVDLGVLIWRGRVKEGGDGLLECVGGDGEGAGCGMLFGQREALLEGLEDGGGVACEAGADACARGELDLRGVGSGGGGKEVDAGRCRAAGAVGQDDPGPQGVRAGGRY